MVRALAHPPKGHGLDSWSRGRTSVAGSIPGSVRVRVRGNLCWVSHQCFFLFLCLSLSPPPTSLPPYLKAMEKIALVWIFFKKKKFKLINFSLTRERERTQMINTRNAGEGTNSSGGYSKGDKGILTTMLFTESNSDEMNRFPKTTHC